MMLQRVAVIGLDGAILDIVERGVGAGRLPTFARILEQGSSAHMESTHPMSTVPAWKVMTTGKNPGKLGYFDFVSKKLNSYEQVLFNSSLVNDKELWDYAADAGARVGVFNVPGTYPPRPINGVMVTGLMTPSTDVPFTYPPEFREEITRVAGKGYVPDIVRPASGLPLEELENMRRVTRMHARTAAHIIDTTRPDFFMGVLTVTDKSQHFYWHVMDPNHPHHNAALAEQLGDPVMDMYALADGAVGDWLERLGPDTTALVVSDHGGRGFGGMFHINQWFRDRGWLEPKHQMRSQLRSRGLDRLYGLMPDWVKRAARPFTHQGVGHNLAHGVDEIFDMSRTRIYALTSGQVFINLKGRDPQGVVEPGAEYDELIEQVRDGLSQVRDPLTGRCLDITIWRREEIWSGPYLDRAPDLYVEVTDPYYSDASNLNPRGALFSYYGEHYADFVGVHRRMGMLLALGPDIQAGSRLEPVKITDVAPTVLHLMGLPIPRDMDGRVLERFFRPDSEAARRTPILQDSTLVDQQAQDFDEEDAAVVAQRLRDLGYFE